MVGLEALLPDTKAVLIKLSVLDLLKDFTFVGGSALAVHLNHRLSEDIDLFTWQKELNIEQIQKQLELLNFKEIRTVSLNRQQCNYIVDGVKLTYFANNWNLLKDASPLIGNVQIANLELLCTMKVNTLFLRAKYRDYYDLFVINKTMFPLEKMYEIASPKLNNLSKALFQKALLFIDDIQDETIQHLKPKYQISLNQISEHFNMEIKLWNSKL